MGPYQIVQIVGLAFVALEMRVALAAVIVDGAGFVIIIDDDEQDNGIGGVFAGFDCVFEKIMSVNAIVDRNYFHPGSDAGFECQTTDDGIGYGTIFVHLKADAVGISSAAAASGHFGRLVRVNDFPSAIFDSSDGSVGRSGGEFLVEETGPVVWRDAVERVDNFFKRVSFYFRAVVWAAMKLMSEIVDGFLAVCFAINDGGNFEPD